MIPTIIMRLCIIIFAGLSAQANAMDVFNPLNFRKPGTNDLDYKAQDTARKRYITEVKQALNEGKDINQLPGGLNGNELLHNLISLYNKNDHIDLIKDLIAHGADINYANNNGLTPLHNCFFCMEGEPDEIVKLLINAGANVNHPSILGQTPLYMALTSSTVQEDSVINQLVTAGADVEQTIKTIHNDIEEREKKPSPDDCDNYFLTIAKRGSKPSIILYIKTAEAKKMSAQQIKSTLQQLVPAARYENDQEIAKLLHKIENPTPQKIEEPKVNKPLDKPIEPQLNIDPIPDLKVTILKNPEQQPAQPLEVPAGKKITKKSPVQEKNNTRTKKEEKPVIIPPINTTAQRSGWHTALITGGFVLGGIGVVGIVYKIIDAITIANIKKQQELLKVLIKKIKTEKSINTEYKKMSPKLTLISKLMHSKIKTYIQAQNYPTLIKIVENQLQQLSTLQKQTIFTRIAAQYKNATRQHEEYSYLDELDNKPHDCPYCDSHKTKNIQTNPTNSL